ncbi:unnamed protein product [Cylicocyclus nassatus]|uniref:Uncharacterized protein n=1 Tax=Cylicocyclus nassatus TaxID=53992 RepID=A0AA36H636_CYLNA|nr:unnamed protein product [Cylicocyclus nassatus]
MEVLFNLLHDMGAVPSVQATLDYVPTKTDDTKSPVPESSPDVSPNQKQQTPLQNKDSDEYEALPDLIANPPPPPPGAPEKAKPTAKSPIKPKTPAAPIFRKERSRDLQPFLKAAPVVRPPTDTTTLADPFARNYDTLIPLPPSEAVFTKRVEAIPPSKGVVSSR